jgi:HAD superfamily hydrolase (TIGR01509 family)
MKPSPIAFQKIPTLSELKAAYPGLKSLLFDMDGTIFNTETYHASALMMIGQKYKIRPPHSPEVVHELMMGKADYLVFEIIKDWEGVPKDWTVDDFVSEKNLNLIEILSKINVTEYFPSDTFQLIDLAKKEGLFLGLVTSSEKVITEELLRLAKLEGYFELILTRDDCPKHKPDPWPYLKAIELSGIDKTATVIFEDSHVGLTAALDSGSHVIKVEWF